MGFKYVSHLAFHSFQISWSYSFPKEELLLVPLFYCLGTNPNKGMIQYHRTPVRDSFNMDGGHNYRKSFRSTWIEIKKEIKTLELSNQSVDSFSKKREKQGE